MEEVLWTEPRTGATGRLLTREAYLLLLLVAFYFCAAVIHAVAAVQHASEYWPYAAFFAILSPAQFGWGVWLWLRPNRLALRWGAIGSFAIVVLWVVTRTVGFPISPEPWHPEAVGLVDVCASIDELGVVILTAIMVESRSNLSTLLHGDLGWKLTRVAAYAVIVVSLVSVFVVGHHHGI